jgi:co-chaperonin GroES (HSP10)
MLYGKRVKVVPNDSQTEENGIIIPDSSKGKSQIGTVIEIGVDINQSIEEGDMVEYFEFTLNPCKHDKGKFVIDFDDIIENLSR